MIAWWEYVVRLVLAAALGGAIGWEREMRQKPAGLRTLMLVSLASGIYVLAATQGAAMFGEPLDAVRAMAGLAQGIGFLGGGVILHGKGEVRWLTTAAALWASAALGFAAGLGLYGLALASGLLVYAILRWVVLLEGWLLRKRNSHDKEPQKRSDV